MMKVVYQILNMSYWGKIWYWILLSIAAWKQLCLPLIQKICALNWKSSLGLLNIWEWWKFNIASNRGEWSPLIEQFENFRKNMIGFWICAACLIVGRLSAAWKSCLLPATAASPLLLPALSCLPAACCMPSLGCHFHPIHKAITLHNNIAVMSVPLQIILLSQRKWHTGVSYQEEDSSCQPEFLKLGFFSAREGGEEAVERVGFSA